MSNKFRKIIDLISRTGDRLIVYDPSEECDPYVVLRLEDYEKLLKSPQILTDCNLSDKINDDIEEKHKIQDFCESKPNLLETVLVPEEEIINELVAKNQETGLNSLKNQISSKEFIEPNLNSSIFSDLEESLEKETFTEEEVENDEILWQAEESITNSLTSSNIQRSIENDAISTEKLVDNPYRPDNFAAISSILEDRKQQFERIRKQLKSQ